MTIDLLYETDHAVTLTLAEIGHRESNDYNNFVFSSIGGTDINWTKHWSVGVRYDQLDTPITLGSLLNDVNITSMPYEYKITPVLSSQKGLIGREKSANSGFTRFGFGGFLPNTPYCDVKCAVDIEYGDTYASCYLAHGYIDGEEVIGLLGIDTRSAQYPSYLTPYFIYNEEFSNFLLENVNPEPGQKTYKPPKTKYRKKGTGGVGTRPRGTSKDPIPSYETDELENPGEPDESSASAINSGMITAYDITPANLTGLATCLFSETLQTAVTGMLMNPLDWIVSLNVFPYTPHIGSPRYLKLGRWSCEPGQILDGKLGTASSGAPLTQQFRTIHFGQVSIGENWGSFLDYSNTQIELYLPFIGCIDLDTSEVMNGTIDLDYTIDFFTGMCVANVCCNRIVETPDYQTYTQYAQHSYQGNCAINVPLGQIQYGNMVGSFINAGASGLRSGGAGAVLSLASDIASGGMKPSVTTKGTISGNAGYCSILRPYVKITRPISAESDSFQEVMGYPSYVDSTLGECEDLCICESIDLHSVSGATDNELNRIRQMCLEGVHV